MRWTYITRHGVKLLASSDGRIAVYSHERRVRLRRPVYGNRHRTDRWFTVTIDRTPLYLPGTRRVAEFRTQNDAKTAALDAATTPNQD
jgi:hypothetical protein